MSTLIPNWTDNITVLAPYALIANNTGYVRTTTGLDLRTKFGGWLKLAIAAGGNNTFTGYAKVYRVFNNDGANSMNGSLFFSAYQTLYGMAVINNVGGYPAGTNSIAYDGASGYNFQLENTLCLWGVTSWPSSNGYIVPNYGVEWLNMSSGVTSPLIFNMATKYQHNDNEYITIGSQWDVWLPGGSKYAVVFDRANSGGQTCACAAYIQTYDSITEEI
jgi:hypothetical protein